MQVGVVTTGLYKQTSFDHIFKSGNIFTYLQDITKTFEDIHSYQTPNKTKFRFKTKNKSQNSTYIWSSEVRPLGRGADRTGAPLKCITKLSSVYNGG